MRINLLLVLVMLFFFCENSSAKEKFYPVSNIPPALLENANSVVRKKETVLEIFSLEKIKYSYKEVITVLNKNGVGEGVFYVPYDLDTKVDIKTANFYDKNGILIKKVKKSDIYDQSYFDGFSMYNDARFKSITPQIKSYPYTVEYECVVECDGVGEYADWIPCYGFSKSIEYADFKIKIHDDSKIRIKSERINPVINGEKHDGVTTYFWEVKDMNALESEPYAVSFRNFVPRVIVAPTDFSYCGVKGNMKSWKDLGNWTWGLITDKVTLPDERVQAIKDLTSSEEDTLDKIKLVYKFLQDKTRYVNVSVGIGGSEPVAAAKVDEVGYGDCKALSNYMRALLQSIGIKSYYTLVGAGKNPTKVNADFPSDYFNHIILTIPLNQDTLFLECTNKYSPCGFLGSFTDDREALLIEENKSRLIHTTTYEKNDNTWNLHASIHLMETGNATIADTVTFKGLQYEFVDDELRKTKKEQIESEFKSSNISGAKYVDVNYVEKRTPIPEVTRVRKIEVDRLATKMGDRMFIPVNILNKRTSVPKKVKERKYPFKSKMDYQDDDSVILKIPQGYDVEYLPEPVAFETVFGKYSNSLKRNGDEIIFSRHEEREKAVFPPEKYAEYVSFVKQIVDADKQKIVLKKL